MTDIATQAAEWLVKLSAEDPQATTDDYADFEQWKQRDPRHAKAVKNMEDIVGRLHNLPPEPANATLSNSAAMAYQDTHSSWAQLAKTFCLVLCLGLPLWLLMPMHSVSTLMADYHSSTGEWQTHTLADDSTIMLSSNSAINVLYTEQHRVIELIQGDVLVDVAKDADRPFVVQTEQGTFTALGTRFTVQQNHATNHQNHQHNSVLTVLESRVAVNSILDNMEVDNQLVLKPGQRITLFEDHIGSIKQLDHSRYEKAWRDHLLVANGLPLSEVLTKLKRVHHAHLDFDNEALKDIRVYAVLPLDEPERALQLLSDSLPIELNSFTPWWVSIKKN